MGLKKCLDPLNPSNEAAFDLRNDEWNDRLSSVKVGKNVHFTYYEHIYWGARWYLPPGTESDVAWDAHYNLHTARNWGDIVSSIVVPEGIEAVTMDHTEYR